MPLLERRRLRMEIDGHYEDSAPSSPTVANSDLHHHHHEHPNAPHIQPSASHLNASTSIPLSHPSPSTSGSPSSSATSSPRRLAKRTSPPSDDGNESSGSSSAANKRTRFQLPRPTPLSASVSFNNDSTSPPLPSSSLQLPPLPSSQPANAEASSSKSSSLGPCTAPPPPRRSSSCRTLTRPWKEVYTERLTIERNWRRGRYAVRTFKGHTDGVMCLQVLEGEEFSQPIPCGGAKGKGKGKEKASPGQGIMITGSYDRTARVWDLESGKEVMVSSNSPALA